MKRRKVGAFTASDLIMPAIVIGGAIFLYNKLSAGPGADVSKNNDSIDQSTIKTGQQEQAAAKAAGSQQTITDSALNTLANTLYYQLTNGVDQTQIVNNLYQLNTWADWAKLVTIFGVKKVNINDSTLSLCAILSINCPSVDLGTLIKTVLDSNRKSDLNDYFNEVGIPAQF